MASTRPAAPIVAGVRARELATWVGGELVGGDPQTRLGGVCTDTRKLEPGQTFVALRGERFDGHRFVDQALAAGAAGVVVERGSAPTVEPEQADSMPGFVVEVDDTLVALGQLASAVIARRRAMGDYIAFALTGSNGKTTTKELLASLLGSRFRVHSTRGNYNNDIGVPLTAFELTADHEVSVFEMGASAVGDIERLVRIVAPDVSILTSVGPAHLEGFGSLEGVARGKGEIFDHASGAERFVVPLDLIERWYPQLGDDERTTTVGVDARATLQVTDVEAVESGTQASYLLADGTSLQLRIPLMGGHNAHNLGLALAACEGVAWEAGEADVESRLQAALDGLELPGGRMEIRRYAEGVVVLQDAYNANPASMRAALAVLGQRAPQPEHRLVVLGEMKELGADAVSMHAELGEAVAALAPRLLFSVGDDAALTAALAEGARRAGLAASSVREVASAAIDSVTEQLQAALTRGDVVLLKGSRGVALERIADALDAALTRTRAPDG